MNTPENIPVQHESGDPKVNAAEQDVITNNDESEKAVNKDGAVADMDGIQQTISESTPVTNASADSGITDNDTDNTVN